MSSVTRADPISNVTIINNYYTNYTPVISPWWNTYFGDWGISRYYSYSPWTVWRADCGIPTFYRHYNSWNPHYNDYGFCNYGISWYNPYYNDCNPYDRYWNPVGVYRNGWCTPLYSQSNNPIHTETAPPNTSRTWGLTRVPKSNVNEVRVWVGGWIEYQYNMFRLHSSINYCSPMEFENLWWKNHTLTMCTI